VARPSKLPGLRTRRCRSRTWRSCAELTTRSTGVISTGCWSTAAPDTVLDWSNARTFDAGAYRGYSEIRTIMQPFLAAFDRDSVRAGSGRGRPLDHGERGSNSAPPAGAVAIPLRNHSRCPGRRDWSVPRWVRRTTSSPTSTKNETAIQLVGGCPCGHATSHRNGLRTATSARTPQPSDLTDECGRIGSERNTAPSLDCDGWESATQLDIDRSLACYRSAVKRASGFDLRRRPDRTKGSSGGPG
jgi:hypothetical protein